MFVLGRGAGGVLAVVGLLLTGLLVLLGLLWRRRPPPAVLAAAPSLVRWSSLHEGIAPIGVTLRWVRGLHRVARPLARAGMAPDALTAAGVWFAALAAAVAASHGAWPIAAGAAVAVSGYLDGLDGAVAVLSGRTSPRGFLLDSVADRIADALFVLALWLAGAPAWLAIAAGGVAAMQEYARARTAAGPSGASGQLTPGERPVRVAVTTVGLVVAGLIEPARAGAATAAAGVLLMLAVVSMAMLMADPQR